MHLKMLAFKSKNQSKYHATKFRVDNEARGFLTNRICIYNFMYIFISRGDEGREQISMPYDGIFVQSILSFARHAVKVISVSGP